MSPLCACWWDPPVGGDRPFRLAQSPVHPPVHMALAVLALLVGHVQAVPYAEQLRLMARMRDDGHRALSEAAAVTFGAGADGASEVVVGVFSRSPRSRRRTTKC